MSAYSDYKVGALSEEEFKVATKEIDGYEDEEEDTPCTFCTEKWNDNGQEDCPWHMNTRRCEFY